MKEKRGRVVEGRIIKIALAIVFALLMRASAFAQTFTPGNLVVSVEGNGVEGALSGPYTDNQAGPLTLFQYAPTGSTSATYVNSFVLPQTASGSNGPVSAEYGSSSEATLQLSGNGYLLTIMGYGVNAADFNVNPGSYSPDPGNTALGQSGSQSPAPSASYTPVPRVVALIDAFGNVNSSTGIYNVFNANNPRSAYTLDGQNIYVSGQGTSGDTTGGVFYTTLGTSSATAITGLDTSSGTAAQDTRTVQIFNNTLYVSVDSKQGSGSNRDFIGTLGSPPATSLFNSGAGPTQLPGFATSSGKVTITSGVNSNGNGPNAGKQINISPENYFFANSTTLYVADSGAPKNNSASSSLGDGGLQKWSLVSGNWVLDYTLYNGLNLVANSNTSGTSGLYGLTGHVNLIAGTVDLYTTNYTLADLDQTYLYGITDTLSFTTASQASRESFAQLATAPADSNFKGVSFAPAVTTTPTPTASPTATVSPAPTATATPTTTITATTAATPTTTGTITATTTPTATATPAGTPTTTITVGPASCGSGSVVEGNSSTTCVYTLNNTGFTNHAIVGSITIDDTTDFGVFFTDCQAPGGIPAQSGCSINVSFTPQTTGSFTTHMHVFDNATASPQTVTITGTGSLPPPTTDSFSPNPLDFGGSPVTVANEQFITVNNTGFTNPLVLQTLTLTDTTAGYTGANEFSLVPADSSCPIEPAGLGPGSSCIIAIDLTPDVSHIDASITGTLVATSNATTSPDTINLTGYGVSGITGDGDCYTAPDGSCDATQSSVGFAGKSCLIDTGTCTTVAGPGCNCQ